MLAAVLSCLAALVDLVFPRHCVTCRAGGVSWCASCRPAPRVADVDCLGAHVVAAGRYEEPVRSVLLAYKERGRRDLARPLGDLLGAAVARARAPAAAVLVPMPSSRAAAARRGGNHVQRLARRAGSVTGLRVAPGALRLGRSVHDSAGLTVAERRRNVHGAMRAMPGHGRVAVVVDDIVTTGASIAEAQRALAAAGWRPAGAAVIAATVRHHPDLRGRPPSRARDPSDPLAPPR